MTDDESRKAFEEWAQMTVGVALSPDGGCGNNEFDRADVLDAIQWATKRERENIDTEAIAWAYGKLRNFGVLDNTMDNAMMADRLMAMLQEPKP